MFSDYYSYLNHQYMDGQTQWVPDNTVANATGDGSYQYWDSTNLKWVTTPKTDPNVPVQHDVPVYWLSMNITTPQGNGASPGSAYADNLRVLPVRTIGNLSQPFHDIVTGAGRSQTDGDYVARVTYSTPTGLITDNLIIPSSYGTMYVGFNIPDKGELVRVDIVEAGGANLDKYLENKVVASYVNSNALANLLFKGDATFSGSSASTRARLIAVVSCFWCMEHVPETRRGTILPRSVTNRPRRFSSL
jgi:hypothetical protein